MIKLLLHGQCTLVVSHYQYFGLNTLTCDVHLERLGVPDTLHHYVEYLQLQSYAYTTANIQTCTI